MKKIDIKEFIQNIEKNVSLEELIKSIEKIDKESIKKDGFKTFNLLINAVKNSKLNSIKIHKDKLKEQIKEVANDLLFVINEMVSVKRHSHGWVSSGDMLAQITKVNKNEDGIWSYSAIVTSEDMNGCCIEINHTRDAISIEKPKKLKK